MRGGLSICIFPLDLIQRGGGIMAAAGPPEAAQKAFHVAVRLALSEAWWVLIRIRNDNELILWGPEALTVSRPAGLFQAVLAKAQPQVPSHVCH